MSKKIINGFLFVALIIFSYNSFAQNFKKETAKNDPMNAVIYTLDNGLKVYLSVNKDEPRIQTYIAVRVGSKNDPKESTGLSHYLEHLMFKGTTHYGTMDWNKEQSYIKEIEHLYEVYNHTTDKVERAKIYHQIDSVSYIASKYAIPNEYDKMMSMIGSQNTNAFTSNDMTVYQEDIPSNELERWAKIQSDRFTNPVFRLFHTELEAVYEEKNMNMANDGRTVYEKMYAALFPNHPYGQQTTIGTIEHLKNPSLTNINKHFSTYYVPNNYCIAMSGDFDINQAINIINKYFGQIPSKQVPQFTFPKEEPITSVKTVDVYGLDAENLTIAYRIYAGTGSKEVMMAQMIDAVLNNGSCGLIDENLIQKQLCQRANSGVNDLNDYSAFMLSGTPKQGQSLEQLKDLLLKQIEILKSGNWDESLLTAAINNWKLSRMKQLESNSSRAMDMASCYLAHRNWQDCVDEIDNMSKITKKEVVDFANQLFKDNNYVVVYKHQGAQRDVQKVEKPPITPVVMNRDYESDFFKEVKNMSVNNIEPSFVNYDKDLQHGNMKSGNEILYVNNKQNNRFDISFEYSYGYACDKKAQIINTFGGKLESKNMKQSEIKKQMYDLACQYSISIQDDKAYVSISGLSDNFEKALKIVEDIINNPSIEKTTVDNSIKDMQKRRKDAKANQNSCASALYSYGSYGKDALKYTLSNDEINSITPDEITSYVKTMTSYPSRVLYYGDMSLSDLTKVLNKNHKTHKSSKVLPKIQYRDKQQTPENKVIFVNYDAKQSLCRQYTTTDVFDINKQPYVDLYNEYFGGSMNSIVFQEIREKRSLAYSAAAYYVKPNRKDLHYQNLSHIGTQNDKLIDALNAFNDLFDNMPVSELNFNLAKQNLLSQYRTNRTTKMNIIWSYLDDENYGLKENPSKSEYNKLQTMTLDDVVNFNKQYIKNRPRLTVILGNEKEVDFNGLSKFGKLQKLTLEDIFGY